MADGVTPQDKQAMMAAITQAKKAGLLAPQYDELTYKLAPPIEGSEVPVSVEHITAKLAVVKVSRGDGIDATAVVNEKGRLASEITIEPITNLKGFSDANQQRIMTTARAEVAHNKELYDSTPNADQIHDLSVAKTNPARALVEQETRVMQALIHEQANKVSIKFMEMKPGEAASSGLKGTVAVPVQAVKAKE